MRRDQLEHAIRTACQIIGQPEGVIVGPQSILGSFAEDQLPTEATMLVEVDILPIVEDGDEVTAARRPAAAASASDRASTCMARREKLDRLGSSAESKMRRAGLG